MDSYQEFKTAVNMAPQELEDWLDTEESREVGQKSSEGAESVGHASGRRIVTLLRTRKDDLTDDDIAHMAKVVSFVHRHLGQGPTKSDVQDSPWRRSLMNWGHDPMKS